MPRRRRRGVGARGHQEGSQRESSARGRRGDAWRVARCSARFGGAEARSVADTGRDAEAAGDTWAVNEFSSAVRAGTNVARQKVEDLVRGLYDGDGTAGVPALKGVVFDIGYGQSTADLSSYKLALQNWYLDAPFWQTMSR